MGFFPSSSCVAFPETFAILTTVSVLPSFTPAWDNLEVIWDDGKLRKCFWASLLCVFFTDGWYRWSCPTEEVTIPVLVVLGNIRKQANKLWGVSQYSASAPASLFLPWVAAPTSLRWWTISCKVKETLSCPGCYGYDDLSHRILRHSPSGRSFSCGMLLLGFLNFSIEDSLISFFSFLFPH